MPSGIPSDGSHMPGLDAAVLQFYGQAPRLSAEQRAVVQEQHNLERRSEVMRRDRLHREQLRQHRSQAFTTASATPPASFIVPPNPTTDANGSNRANISLNSISASYILQHATAGASAPLRAAPIATTDSHDSGDPNAPLSSTSASQNLQHEGSATHNSANEERSEENAKEGTINEQA